MGKRKSRMLLVAKIKLGFNMSHIKMSLEYVLSICQEQLGQLGGIGYQVQPES